MRKKVLFVGEHPHGGTGCGNMLAAILSRVDREKYSIGCFCARNVDPSGTLFKPFPFTVVNATTEADWWGHNRLLTLLQSVKLDILCFVGIDIWTYQSIWKHIVALRNAKGFKIVFIFPHDIQQVRMDWVDWIMDCDVPCVYSNYGYQALKDYVPHLRYFRPPLLNADVFKPLDRAKVRKACFPTVPDDHVIFGFVGANQIRKSPERLIKAFVEAKKIDPKMTLYFHTEMDGIHNIPQIATDFGARTGDLITKKPGIYPAQKMADLYNSMDCLVNCSMQEGLSFTPLEAMLCGTPCILSDTTAQTELGIGVAEMVPCNDMAFLPMGTGSGGSQIEAKACRVADIRRALLKVAKDPDLRSKMATAGMARAKDWLEGVDNINDVLDSTSRIKPAAKIPKVLFAQHSAAGDVLMTTQCFKGIKERHKGLPLVYMTQPGYQDIVTGNPYVDEIIDWKDRELGRYQVVYNPHGDHILHGGFNNLDVTLYSMYPYFCKVEADEMFVEPVYPEGKINPIEAYTNARGDGLAFEIGLKQPYIVVHTTGGSKKYRSYPHMDLALKGIGLPIVQLGGPGDIRCKSDLDLCGKLTFRESAWVMKHAKAAVVIDSFLSHLAGAVGTDVVVLYGPAPARVVQPKMQYGAKAIHIQPDMLAVCKHVTHCWGNIPQCQSPCIHSISPVRVRKALEELWGTEIQQQKEAA
jgi:ADP-heptose:LPS heptosyltransferase/glycosyltransferase involved in cell wall biosynthesis